MSDFDHDYIDFDDRGVIQVRCMRCATPIIQRVMQQVRLNTDPPEVRWVETVVQLPTFRKGRVALADGSYMEPVLCSTCENVPIDYEVDPTVNEKIRQQLIRAEKKHLEFARASTDEIKGLKKKYRKRMILKDVPRGTPEESHVSAVAFAKEFEDRLKANHPKAKQLDTLGEK